MFYLVLHTALLILAAFVLGAIVGCLMKRFLSGGNFYRASSRPTPAESAAAAATATVAARTSSIGEAEARAEAEAAEVIAVEKAAAAAKAAMDDAAAEAALAGLPENASNEEKANAVGTRPAGLAKPRNGKKDSLQRIKGIGKVNEGKLNQLGIYHFSQIGTWTLPEVRWVGTFLSFAGRIEREDWVGQAQVLAKGGETDFAKRVDKGEVATSSTKTKK